MPDILIVDDERVIREGYSAALSGEGYEVRTARSGAEALKRIAEKCPDLVLLDVMMPKMNGFAVCEEIRRADRMVPIVFLSAMDGETDQVRALGLGADDFVSKSAPMSVLLARVRRALDRRREYADGNDVQIGNTVVHFDSLLVDADGVQSQLTPSEANVLRLLLAERGRFLSKSELIASLHGNGHSCSESLVSVHVFNLRKKLGDAGAYIVTDRSAGYRLLP